MFYVGNSCGVVKVKPYSVPWDSETADTLASRPSFEEIDVGSPRQLSISPLSLCELTTSVMGSPHIHVGISPNLNRVCQLTDRGC